MFRKGKEGIGLGLPRMTVMAGLADGTYCKIAMYLAHVC